MQTPTTLEAIEVLKANDRGGFTVPTPRLYPYQWNWDSVFASLGFAAFDHDRAWLELETLFEAQWADGMVPHIVYRNNDPGYFPGPAIWRSRTTPETSGHSQPAVAASVVWKLVETGDRTDRERAARLFPRLFAFNNWFHTMRDPDGTGLVGIIHPWESGRDNCPDWDLAMDRIAVSDKLEPYQRRDTNHINPQERPSTLQYDKYLTIVEFGRECGWDHREIVRNGPFFMADPGVQFILMRADHDLLLLAHLLGEKQRASQIESWIARSAVGCKQLWDASLGCFCARDLKTGTFCGGISSASMLAFYANAGTGEQRRQLASHANEMLKMVRFGIPSWDPRHSSFEAKRYWRGPVWAVMNYMIATGMSEQGEPELAARIKADTMNLIRNSGFCEYFDPLTGQGLGGGQFTWTAAIQLAWSGESGKSRAA
ncbi:MAG: MGH1-like glycoside hydrolase domain-containing protein [Alphaproteobacteria bacterium]